MSNHNKNEILQAHSAPFKPFFQKVLKGFRLFLSVFQEVPQKEEITLPKPDENKSEQKSDQKEPLKKLQESIGVLRHAQAMRVIFYYPGEEGAYVDHALVTLFENGIVHIDAENEVTTTTLSHCEIIWKYKSDEFSPQPGLRLLKFPDRNLEQSSERLKDETGTEPPHVPTK